MAGIQKDLVKLRIVTVDEVQFLTSVLHEVWGSNNPRRFTRWTAGDYLVFIVEKKIAAVAQAIGESFISSDPVWDNGSFPYRIRIRLLHITLQPNRRSVYDEMQKMLWSADTHYGWAVFTQHAVTGNPALKIVEMILSTLNDINAVRENLHRHLDDAKTERLRRQAPAKNRQLPER